MTEFQKKQHLSTFIGTGRKSYLLGVHSSNNPYDKQPFRDLWDKGWRQAHRDQGAFRSQTKPPFPQKSGKSGKSGQEDTRTSHPQKTFTPTTFIKRPHPTSTQPSKPVITSNLVNKFNRRHQTTT